MVSFIIKKALKILVLLALILCLIMNYQQMRVQIELEKEYRIITDSTIKRPFHDVPLSEL